MQGNDPTRQDARQDARQEKVKISANLPRETLERLKTLAYQRGTTMTNVIKQAIEMEEYLEHVRRRKGKVLVEDADGKISQILAR
ncbi:MAG: hypothetical protein D6754_03660 [Alphaproteobacteria bacterium]|nr:MAG: hypothetical protein D6754_03660 [Alphaproteobacteria bacterium]